MTLPANAKSGFACFPGVVSVRGPLVCAAPIMPPAPLPIDRLVSLLKVDSELQEKLDAAAWATLDQLYADYKVRAVAPLPRA